MEVKTAEEVTGKLLCPYCLSMVRINKKEISRKGTDFNSFSSLYICNACGRILDRDIIERKEVPSKMIGIIGFEGQGKFTLIKALLKVLINKANMGSQDWDAFQLMPLDQDLLQIIYAAHSDQELPGNDNYYHAIFKVTNLPKVKEAFISLYTSSGDIFRETSGIVKDAPYCGYCDNLIMAFSIGDAGPIWDRSMKDLLDRYIIAANQAKGKQLSQQKLVVVLTKGELLLSKLKSVSIPEWLSDLQDDNVENNENEIKPCKVQEPKDQSSLIESWLRENGCDSFCNLANKEFLSVQYNITGSLHKQILTEKTQTRLLDLFLELIH